jgi:hypothetical protein
MKSFEIREDLRNLDKKQLYKLIFINNAIEDGWSVKKKENSYIFSKKHENKQEIFDNNYLETFMQNGDSTKKKG